MSEAILTSFEGSNDTERFAAAMAYCRAHPGTTLTVPPGKYILTGKLARAAQEHVMRGDWGRNPQRIMFNPKYEFDRGIDFAGQRGTRVLAKGAALLIDGFMEPVSLRDCEEVEIVGLTIDHIRRPFSQGTVRTVDPASGRAVIEFDMDFPVEKGTPLTLRYLFRDPLTGTVLSASVRSCTVLDSHTAEAELSSSVPDGTRFCTIHTYHSRPAILIERAKNIRLTDVTIHSQPGMGVVGNRSRDIVLTRLRVVPAVGQMWSTNTDATHFTAIRGLLRFENCEFEGQGDDFTNVHGYYQAIVEREDDRTVRIREKTPDGTHAQTLDYPDPGDVLELTSYDTLEVKDSFRVEEVVPMPEEWMSRVTLDRPLPEDTDGWMLADVTALPRLEVIGCHASSHFARSVLIKTRSALIEGNTFRDIQGPAIVAAAESWWYEGVCPANVTIRNNRILNCGWAWGEAAGIVVKADSEHPSGQSIRNILIEDNLIDSPRQEHAVFCRNAEGLTIRRNRMRVRGKPVVIEDCTEVETDG